MDHGLSVLEIARPRLFEREELRMNKFWVTDPRLSCPEILIESC